MDEATGAGVDGGGGERDVTPRPESYTATFKGHRPTGTIGQYQVKVYRYVAGRGFIWKARIIGVQNPWPGSFATLGAAKEFVEGEFVERVGEWL
jgi:hypothetical protein